MPSAPSTSPAAHILASCPGYWKTTCPPVASWKRSAGSITRRTASMRNPLPSKNLTPKWDALILAAGRGPADPIARAFGVTHKCLLAVAGKPMLQRVADALLDTGRFRSIGVSVEDRSVLASALGPLLDRVKPVAADRSASL